MVSAPPDRAPGRPNLVGRPHKTLSNALRDHEHNLVVLVVNAGEWYVVDEYEGTTGWASAMRQALWRRGCEVLTRKHTERDGWVQVWARWPHEIPTEIIGAWVPHDRVQRPLRTGGER